MTRSPAIALAIVASSFVLSLGVAVSAHADTVGGSTIPLGFSPTNVAITPDGSRLALGSSFGADVAGAVNLTSTPASAYTPIGTSQFSPGVAVTPNSRYALVTEQTGSGALAIIDLKASGGPSLVTTFAFSSIGLGGTQPCEITISADGTRAYVSLLGDDSVAELNISALPAISLVAVIPVADQPIGVAVSANEGFLATANQANTPTNNVSIVNLDTNVLTNIALGGDTWDVAFTPDGSRAYVTEYDLHAVAVIDLTTPAPSLLTTVSLPAGAGPRGLAITPDGSRVYVANQDSNTVSVIDVKTNTLSPDALTIPGDTPHPEAIAINTAGTIAYVADANTNDVSVINIDAYPKITTSAFSRGIVGKSYSAPVVATGTAPLSFTVSAGALPPGLTLDTATGVIGGKPTKVGSYSFTISAMNDASGFTGAAAPTSSRTFSIVVGAILAPTGTDPAELSLLACMAIALIVVGAALVARRRSLR